MSRQDWRTPPSVFNCLSERFGPFNMDAAADHDNHLCDNYLTEGDDNPRTVLWEGTVFVNPPFSNITPFVLKAVEHNDRTVMLTHSNTSSPWFRIAINHASLFLPDRRICYWHPKELKDSPDRDTVIWVFGREPNRIYEIEIPEHIKEVRRLYKEAQGQQTLFAEHGALI